jgi:REP element-mobilizing transposase RayT
MSVRYKFGDSHATYFVTFAVVNWVDVFTRNDYREVVVKSINHCISYKGLVVHAWVIMSNHVHLLISLQGDNSSFSDVMRDMKKYTAMQLIKSIRENPQESRKDWMIRLFQVAGKYNSNNTNFQFWR